MFDFLPICHNCGIKGVAGIKGSSHWTDCRHWTTYTHADTCQSCANAKGICMFCCKRLSDDLSPRSMPSVSTTVPTTTILTKTEIVIIILVLLVTIGLFFWSILPH